MTISSITGNTHEIDAWIDKLLTWGAGVECPSAHARALAYHLQEEIGDAIAACRVDWWGVELPGGSTEYTLTVRTDEGERQLRVTA